MIKLIIGSLLSISSVVSVVSGYPWDPDFILKQHLASKSPYYPLQDLTEHSQPPSTCKPIHFNLVNRHGNRNPGDGDILEYQRIEQTVKVYGNKLRYDFMRNFKNPVRYEDEGKLVTKGQYELYDLAKRFSKAYPEVFDFPYDSDSFFMRSTQEQRAMMSGDSFAYSLFERKGKIGPDSYEPHFILSDTESQDYILKYYDNCELYKVIVDDNETANIETELYLEKILPGIAERMTQVITYDQSWNISGDDVLAFHSICQTQAAMYDIEDEFCTLFLQKELEDLEYWEDLDDYYTKSYPYEINYRMTVPLMKDIIYSMVDAANDESVQRANLRFAHSSTVVPLIAVFGLYKDDFIMTSETPQNMIDKRQFRTSVVSPMATNFGFVLYECDNGVRHRVKVLQNEKETIVSGCNELYCPLDTFQKAYSYYLDNDFDSVCQNKK